MNNCLLPLLQLETQELKVLLSLLTGPMVHSYSERHLTQAFGNDRGIRLYTALVECEKECFSKQQIQLLIDAQIDRFSSRKDWFSWVITGLSSPSIPRRDTAVIFRSLINQAKEEVIISTYALYKGKDLFLELSRKMKESENLSVILLCDIRREYRDTSSESEIIARYRRDFLSNQWPGEPYPKIYYYPRALAKNTSEKAVLHAKCIIVDGTSAFVGSANLTRAAQEKNIEVGTMVEHSHHAGSLRTYFMELITDRVVIEMELW